MAMDTFGGIAWALGRAGQYGVVAVSAKLKAATWKLYHLIRLKSVRLGSHC
jgi:hypothetical protein